MKNLIIIFFLFFDIINGNAQKHDYNWIVGYNNYNDGPHSGKVILNFKDSFKIKKDSLMADIHFLGCSVSFSDFNGEKILFYSSGNELYNSENKLLENGDTLGPGKYWQKDKDTKFFLRTFSGFMSVPCYYEDSTVVYFFHTSTGDTPDWEHVNTRLWLTKVVFDDSHPLGIVYEKNI
jgi:hypothetical protein